MKKLTQTLLLIMFSFTFLIGQTPYENLSAIASVNIESNDTYNTSKKFTKKKTKKETEIKKNEIYYDISDVDMSTTIDIKSNTMDFSGGENFKYSKMQLTHKLSSKTIISRKIGSDYKIDLNRIVPGTYILFLSNEKGEIKSEEIIII